MSGEFNRRSKREWFAGMALTGAMIADIELAKMGKVTRGNAAQDLADTCVKIADALLAELKKKS